MDFNSRSWKYNSECAPVLCDGLQILPTQELKHSTNKITRMDFPFCLCAMRCAFWTHQNNWGTCDNRSSVCPVLLSFIVSKVVITSLNYNNGWNYKRQKWLCHYDCGSVESELNCHSAISYCIKLSWNHFSFFPFLL